MKKSIKFFMFSLVIIVVVVLAIFIFNPFNLKGKAITGLLNYYFQVENFEETGKMLDEKKEEKSKPAVSSSTAPQNEEKNYLITDDQKKKLEDMGVDTNSLPKEITPGMNKCFVEKLGQERVNEIINGSTPGPVEIFKTKECLNK